MAAHLEGRGCSVLDMTGMAQKGGAVVSHIRIAQSPEAIHATRITTGGAQLLLGCDIVVAAAADGLSRLREGTSRAVINHHATITAAFTRNPDHAFPGRALVQQIAAAVAGDRADFIDATRLATALLGDSIATNLFMLGYAYQQGLVPVSAEAIEQAVRLSAVAVDFNLRAFAVGRWAAMPLRAPQMLDALIARRVELLTRYQNAAYARRHERRVRRRAAVAARHDGVGRGGGQESL